jgi:hypothetical protein
MAGSNFERGETTAPPPPPAAASDSRRMNEAGCFGIRDQRPPSSRLFRSITHSGTPPRDPLARPEGNRKMIRWFPGSSQGVRSPSSTGYRPGLEGDALDATSRARTERLLLDAKSAATLRHKLALMDITAQRIAGHRSHFNPDQPRVPAGNPDGGQWTSVGGATGSRLAAADKPRLGRGAGIAIFLEVAKRLIEAYRSENGLWDLFGHKNGTIAFTTIDGTKVFGSNSTSPAYTFADKSAALRLRDILVEKYPGKFPTEDVGRMPNDALYPR